MDLYHTGSQERVCTHLFSFSGNSKMEQTRVKKHKLKPDLLVIGQMYIHFAFKNENGFKSKLVAEP